MNAAPSSETTPVAEEPLSASSKLVLGSLLFFILLIASIIVGEFAGALTR
jgi:hypothetical protein